MKVLLISTYSFGGAANACIRLHEGLLQSEIDSNLLFMNFSSNRTIEKTQVYNKQPDKNNYFYRVLRKLLRLTGFGRADYDNKIKTQIKKSIPEKIEWFSFPDSGIDITTHPLFQEADIINIHWIADFVDFSFLKNNKKPIVWTLHDMNAFTGGCHYTGDCKSFLTGCEICPQLSECEDNTYAGRNFKLKKESLNYINNISIVSPSNWLGKLSRSSLLLKKYPYYHIPYGIDQNIFIKEEQLRARQLLNLPLLGKIFLFIADNLGTKRKGYDLLKSAFGKINSDDVFLCSVGRSGIKTNNNINVIELGVIKTEKEMSLVYSAADLFVIPSLEDNLPNTVIEALLCGLPVAGFPVGGIPDMIINGVNGILTKEISVEELVVILQNFLNNKYVFNRTEIRNNAIQKYGIDVQVSAYKALYERLMK